MKRFLPKIIYGMLVGCFGYIAMVGIYCVYLAIAGTPGQISPLKTWLGLTIQGDWVFAALGGIAGTFWVIIDDLNQKSRKRHHV
jgi:hypothetical protein